MKQHIFIIGAKSIGQYGGYETFVDKLSAYHVNVDKIKYHIACKANGEGHVEEEKLQDVSDMIKNGDGFVTEFTYHNAHIFKIFVPNIGSAVAVYYDISALKYSINYCKKYNIKYPIFYILACRIGPFIGYYKKQIKKLNGVIYLNPDGHEFLRSKWSSMVRKYWKISETLMVKYADLVVCDSINIEKYIRSEYKIYNPKSIYISYGADTTPSILPDTDFDFLKWLKRNKLERFQYYLVVGRFVPENNFEIMIREFMKSKSKKDFAIITNVNDKFLSELEKKLLYKKDMRIKFVGTVYEQELLKKIRENAYAYIHGHEVGGTNPSLLEALGATNLNLLLDVGFNREVAQDAAIYWSKNNGDLAELIDKADRFDIKKIQTYGENAKSRIQNVYSWGYIASEYEKIFLRNETNYIHEL